MLSDSDLDACESADALQQHIEQKVEADSGRRRTGDHNTNPA